MPTDTTTPATSTARPDALPEEIRRAMTRMWDAIPNPPHKALRAGLDVEAAISRALAARASEPAPREVKVLTSREPAPPDEPTEEQIAEWKRGWFAHSEVAESEKTLRRRFDSATRALDVIARHDGSTCDHDSPTACLFSVVALAAGEIGAPSPVFAEPALSAPRESPEADSSIFASASAPSGTVATGASDASGDGKDSRARHLSAESASLARVWARRITGDDEHLASTAECVCRHGHLWGECCECMESVLIDLLSRPNPPAPGSGT